MDLQSSETPVVLALIVFWAALVGLGVGLSKAILAARVSHWLLHYPRSASWSRMVSPRPGRTLILTLPERVDRPLAVLLPGAGSRCRESMAAARDFYQAHGLASVEVDWADSPRREGPLGWGPPEARELAEALARFHGPLLLHGRSFGASVAILAQALSRAPWTLVCESAFCSLEEVVRRRLRRFLPAPLGQLTLTGGDLVSRRLRRWGVEAAGNRPVEALSRELARLCLIHGTQDRLVPPDHAQRLYRRAQQLGVEARLFLIPAGRHARLREAKVSLWEEALRWATLGLCGRSN